MTKAAQVAAQAASASAAEQVRLPLSPSSSWLLVSHACMGGVLSPHLTAEERQCFWPTSNLQSVPLWIGSIMLNNVNSAGVEIRMKGHSNGVSTYIQVSVHDTAVGVYSPRATMHFSNARVLDPLSAQQPH